MKQTVVGVFDRYAQAQHAAQQLRESGFGDSVYVTEEHAGSGASSSASGSAQRDEGVMEKVRSFFSDLFGADDEREVSPYADAVGRGGAVVRVEVDEDGMADQARATLEAAGAIDIDDDVSSSQNASTLGAGSISGPDASFVDGGTGFEVGTPLPMSESTGVRSTSLADRADRADRADTASDDVIPVSREQLHAEKRAAATGGVRVYSRTVETPAQESIELRSEKAHVERVVVDRAAPASDKDALNDRTIEIRETSGQPVVAREARTTEEVRVGKTVEQRTEQVGGTVRNTEVEVKQLPTGRRGGSSLDDDDGGFRSHYASNFESGGSGYDEYEPAYRYGDQMRGDSRYGSRSWDDAEPELQRDWESSNPSGTWQRFKSAVRHGWDRVTG